MEQPKPLIFYERIKINNKKKSGLHGVARITLIFYERIEKQPFFLKKNFYVFKSFWYVDVKNKF